MDEHNKPRLLRPSHFGFNNEGNPVDFMKDFMVGFFHRYAKAIQSVHKDAIIFVGIPISILSQYSITPFCPELCISKVISSI